MKKFLLLCASLSLFAKTVNFNTVLKETLNSNLELKAKRLNIKKAEADFKKAKGFDWGKLIFNEQVSRTNNPLYVFGMKLESHEATFRDFGFSDFLGGVGQALQMAGGDFGKFTQMMSNPAMQNQLLNTAPHDLNYPKPRTNFKTSIVYEVPIFTGFKIKYAKEMAALQIQAQKFKYSHDKKALAIEVLKAYNGAVAAKEFVKALEIAKKTTTSFVKMIRDFYNQGMATKIDLLQAKKRDNEVDAMLIEAQNKYKLALSYLQFLSDDPTITGVGDFEVIYPPNAPLSKLIKLALQNRSDLKWMKKNVETMQKKVKFDESVKYPMIGAHLEYGWSDNQFDNINAQKDYYLVAAGLKWNVFDKSADADIEKSKIEALQTDYYYQYMKKGIALDVKQKYLDFKTKAALVKEKEVNKELAEEILKKYTYMYKQGMINITILLMKEAEARKARAELIKAEYDEALAAAKLQQAIGEMLKESK